MPILTCDYPGCETQLGSTDLGAALEHHDDGSHTFHPGSEKLFDAHGNVDWDWKNPNARLSLCTALSHLLSEYAPEGYTVQELVDAATALNAREREAVLSYFGPDKIVREI